MKILVLNQGSSSIKCVLYEFNQSPDSLIAPLWEAHLQWKESFSHPFLMVTTKLGVKYCETLQVESLLESLEYLIPFLFQGETAVLNSLEEIDVVGHRIVHGGNYFNQSVFITPEVKEKICLLSDIAPLHNLSELQGIETLEKLLKNIPQFAVFDTAFHHTLPIAVQIYPGPYTWYQEGIRRYGFHGISFQYCSRRVTQLLNQDLKSLKVVIWHLGSGASLCAIEEGKSIDTTRGFTPLEGLMMDTRSGSIDPGILLYLLEKKKRNIEELSHELYCDSGLLGISGVSSDMRDVIEKSLEGHIRAQEALDVYIHRLNASIGAMVASLKGLDVLVFTAGIGENSPLIRDLVCEAFSFLGISLDKKENIRNSLEDRDLATRESKVRVLLIHTQECFEIASECWQGILIK